MNLKTVREMLAEAEAELAMWQEKWDRYDGNNPNKFRSDIRLASDRVRNLKDQIARMPTDLQ